jgi:hypothetical protein
MNMQARMSQWPLRRRREKGFPPAALLAEIRQKVLQVSGGRFRRFGESRRKNDPLQNRSAKNRV